MHIGNIFLSPFAQGREARVAMMEDNKAALSSMYTVDDNLMVVFRFTHATATIYSFTSEPEVYTL